MRLSPSDLIPLLVIMGSGAVGVLGIFAFAAACGVPLPTAFQDDERDEARHLVTLLRAGVLRGTNRGRPFRRPPWSSPSSQPTPRAWPQQQGCCIPASEVDLG